MDREDRDRLIRIERDVRWIRDAQSDQNSRLTKIEGRERGYLVGLLVTAVGMLVSFFRK